MITRILLAFADRLALLAAVLLPITATASLLIAALAAERIGGAALLLPCAALLALILACDLVAPREPNRAELLHRLGRLSLHPQEEALFAALLRDPNTQRLAAAAFGSGLLRFAALLGWLLAALTVIATMITLLPILSPGLAPLAALLLALIGGARVHDAVASRALAHLVPAAGRRVLATAAALSDLRLARIEHAVLQELRDNASRQSRAA